MTSGTQTSTAKLTVVGDSFAEGRGGAVREDGTFAGFVAQMANVLGISDGIVNLGTFGATTQDVVEGQLAVALRNPAPFIGVIVGGNDVVTGDDGYNRDRFQCNLRHICTSLVQPGRVVFTTNWPNIPDHLPVFPTGFGRYCGIGSPRPTNTWTSLSTSLIWCAWISRTQRSSRTRPCGPRIGMHPSPAGHQAVAIAMADLIDAAMTARV